MSWSEKEQKKEQSSKTFKEWVVINHDM